MKVTVYELEKLADGTLRVGNSLEVGVAEAVAMIKAQTAKAADACIGDVPEGWQSKKKSGGGSGVVTDGIDSD